MKCGGALTDNTDADDNGVFIDDCWFTIGFFGEDPWETLAVVVVVVVEDEPLVPEFVLNKFSKNVIKDNENDR